MDEKQDALAAQDALALKIRGRSKALFDEHVSKIYKSADRVLAVLLVIEWIGGMVTAALVSPQTWQPITSGHHYLHLNLAIWLGLAIITLPVFLALKFSGKTVTRHTMAVAQVLITALLIHLTGGRIETHFLIFASLIFLAFYRDWKVLVTASALVALDLWYRGMNLPFSVYGVTTVEPWRWVEHMSWVVFANVFLIRACVMGRDELLETAKKRAQLELTNEIIEAEVIERTEEMKLSEERFRTLCLSVPTVIFKSEDSGGWEVFGQQWIDLTGVNSERARKWWTLAPEGDQEELRQSWQDALSNGGDWAEEFCIVTPASGFKWVRGRAQKCSVTGEMPQFIGTLEDISERKTLEEKTRRLMLLQQREDFLAMLANDLKNPIVGANRVLELLYEGKLGEINEVQMDVLSRLMDANKELLNMIQNISSVYRYEKESNSLKFKPLSLSRVALDCLNKVRSAADEKNIELSYDFNENENMSIVGDSDSIMRMIGNLLDNALKFTPDHEHISLRGFSRQGQVVLQIANTGSHIDDEQQSVLFKRPVTSIDGKKYLPRAGLGLYLCRQILEAHNGEISCQSNEDVGTVFTVSLPRKLRTGEFTLPPSA